TDIPPTALGTGLNVTTLSFHLDDATDWPTAGRFWVGPGSITGEAGGYCQYHTSSTGTGLGTISVHDVVSDEYTGTHTIGGGVTSEVRFWWPLDGIIDGAFEWSSVMEKNVVTWSGNLEGFNIPQAALRNRHLILIQFQWMNEGGTGWDSWKNGLI